MEYRGNGMHAHRTPQQGRDGEGTIQHTINIQQRMRAANIQIMLNYLLHLIESRKACTSNFFHNFQQKSDMNQLCITVASIFLTIDLVFMQQQNSDQQ